MCGTGELGSRLLLCKCKSSLSEQLEIQQQSYNHTKKHLGKNKPFSFGFTSESGLNQRVPWNCKYGQLKQDFVRFF